MAAAASYVRGSLRVVVAANFRRRLQESNPIPGEILELDHDAIITSKDLRGRSTPYANAPNVEDRNHFRVVAFFPRAKHVPRILGHERVVPDLHRRLSGAR
jgi:hypothetical protein